MNMHCSLPIEPFIQVVVGFSGVMYQLTNHDVLTLCIGLIHSHPICRFKHYFSWLGGKLLSALTSLLLTIAIWSGSEWC